MKLYIQKELIEIAFLEEDLEEIEIEQDFDGPKVYRQLQNKIDKLLEPKMQNYMSRNGFKTLESSGYVLSLLNRGMLTMSFTIFKDDEEWTNEELNFNIEFDYNLNVIKMNVKNFNNKYIFKM